MNNHNFSEIMTKTHKIVICNILFFSNLLYAEDFSQKLNQSCIQQQLNDHKGLKNRKLTAKDFGSYCSCESDYIQKNSTEDQRNELNKSSVANQEWLNLLKMKAAKSCLNGDTKLNS
jgi:hypothetical protein